MSYEKMGGASLNLFPCRYRGSRLTFRGPQRDLSSDYVAILGGTDTYGKFVRTPFAALLEQEIGMNCVNFGVINAGIDAFICDPEMIEIARNARLTVLHITGAQNNSNRLYSVHPRRNDRFVKPSRLMTQMFRELDFTDFHFTRHLLQATQRKAPDRYGFLCEELKQAWLARMATLVRLIGGKIILLWFADHSPDNKDRISDPLFVTREMIEEIRPLVNQVVEVVIEPKKPPEDLDPGICRKMELPAPFQVLSAAAHASAAARLSGAIKTLASK